jgi:hypothetical protein
MCPRAAEPLRYNKGKLLPAGNRGPRGQVFVRGVQNPSPWFARSIDTLCCLKIYLKL